MQPINFRYVVSLTILIAFLACSSGGLGQRCSAPAQISLIYSEQAPSSNKALVLCSPDGQSFSVSFDPRVDVQHHVVELDLVLQTLRKKGSNSNLLIVNRSWHGYQPFTFGAADYVEGAENSVFGEERTIGIPHSRNQLIADVTEARVEAEKPDELGKIHYRFVRLVLRISVQDRSRAPR